MEIFHYKYTAIDDTQLTFAISLNTIVLDNLTSGVPYKHETTFKKANSEISIANCATSVRLILLNVIHLLGQVNSCT